MPAQTVIQIRRDTAANWESTDPTLASGEIGFDTTNNQIKIGNGSDEWTVLDYASGGSGSITVSETAPAEPAEGDLWFNSTNALTYIYYDSFWVDLAPAIAGPAGPIGESGIVVQDEAPTDTDVLWLDSDDPADAVAVPAGGTTGQVLAKATGDDYDTEWTTLPEAPSGNAIINGAFEIWQRGASFTSASGTFFPFTADRNKSYTDGGAVTVSRVLATLNDIVAIGYGEPQYYFRFDKTGSGGTLSSPIVNYVEDVRTLANQTVTLSFWAKANAATSGVARITQFFGTGGSTAAFVESSSISITTGWARYSVTLTMPSLAGKTLGPGSGLEIQPFRIEGSGTHTIDFWGLQLEAGSTATPFRRNANSLQGELAACQRYYYRIPAVNAFGAIASGRAISTTTVFCNFTPKQTMRTVPSSVDFSTASTLRANGTTCTNVYLSAGDSSADLPTIAFEVASGLTTGSFVIISANNNSSAFVGVSAEL
jgi:hypothetical protein